MIDLHMHTINSDGSDSPEEILKKCEKLNLEYISITDHDTCKSYKDLEKVDVKKIFSGIIIPGCELTTVFEGRTIEILGYGVNVDIINEWKENYYSKDKMIEHKEYTVNSIISNLNKLGVNITRDQVVMNCSPDRAVYNVLKLNKDENEKVLGEGILDSFRTFFREGVTNPDNSLYVDTSMYRPPLQEVVDIVHKAEGKAFLAHAYQYVFNDILEMITSLRKEVNIDGLEVFHSSFTLEQMMELQEYAKKNNLFISGGSDYHGTVKEEISLKTGCDNLHISKNILEWLEKA